MFLARFMRHAIITLYGFRAEGSGFTTYVRPDLERRGHGAPCIHVSRVPEPATWPKPGVQGSLCLPVVHTNTHWQCTGTRAAPLSCAWDQFLAHSCAWMADLSGYQPVLPATASLLSCHLAVGSAAKGTLPGGVTPPTVARVQHWHVPPAATPGARPTHGVSQDTSSGQKESMRPLLFCHCSWSHWKLPEAARRPPPHTNTLLSFARASQQSPGSPHRSEKPRVAMRDRYRHTRRRRAAPSVRH